LAFFATSNSVEIGENVGKIKGEWQMTRT